MTTNCAARLLGFHPQRDLVLRTKRPDRENQVAVAAHFERYVVLIECLGRVQPGCQQLGLMVESRAADVVVDLLQADHVGLEVLDDLGNPLKAIATVAAADALVNVVADDAHGMLSWLGATGGLCRVRNGFRRTPIGVTA